MVSSDSRVVSPEDCEGVEGVEDVEGDGENVENGEERPAAGGEGEWEAELMVSVRHGPGSALAFITGYGRFCGASQPFDRD